MMTEKEHDGLLEDAPSERPMFESHVRTTLEKFTNATLPELFTCMGLLEALFFQSFFLPLSAHSCPSPTHAKYTHIPSAHLFPLFSHTGSVCSDRVISFCFRGKRNKYYAI